MAQVQRSAPIHSRAAAALENVLRESPPKVDMERRQGSMWLSEARLQEGSRS